MECPVCAGIMRKRMVKEEMFGVSLGSFPAWVCSKCKESFTDEETTRQIEAEAKRQGIWGMGQTTKITKSGNSLAVRIPKKMADYLGLRNGKEAYIHPEGKKIVIDVS